jgi:hypothetical protein
VIAGAIIRVELLSGGKGFDFLVARVLLALGLWLVRLPVAEIASVAE